MWVVAVAGAVLLACGLLAYAGVGRGVTLSAFPTPYLFFGLAWWGAAGVLCGVGLMLQDSVGPGLTAPLLLVGIGCFVVALMSFFWLPTKLRPRWFRDWQADQRRAQRVRDDAVKPDATPGWRRGGRG